MTEQQTASPPQTHCRDGYTISTDKSRLDIDFIHTSLTTQTYWAQNRPLDVMQKAVQNSLNFGLYYDGKQVGYARVVTDYATFAWLCDVFVAADHRQKALGKWMVDCVTKHPDLKHIRRILLATRDAHELYRKYGGFEPLSHVERWMERFNPNT